MADTLIDKFLVRLQAEEETERPSSVHASPAWALALFYEQENQMREMEAHHQQIAAEFGFYLEPRKPREPPTPVAGQKFGTFFGMDIIIDEGLPERSFEFRRIRG